MTSDPRSRSILLGMAAAGAAALVAQVVLLREILASSHGNELVLGVVLAGWLTSTGVASAIGGRGGKRKERPGQRLGWILRLAPVLLLASLWLVRFTEPATVGQDMPLDVVVGFSLVALAPASLLGGLCFAWATVAIGDKRKVASVYVAETLGMALAGVVFHFVLAEGMGSAWILWGAGTICALASLAPGMCCGEAGGLRRGRWMIASALVVVTLTGVAAPRVAASLLAARFPGVQVLAARPSRYGLLAVLARAGQHIFVHDGVLLFTSEDVSAAEETVHLPLLLHPHPRRILMVGGGLGGGLVEALKHGPARIDYAEMDPDVLALARRYADPGTRAALADPRVHALTEDARRVLRESRARYDVILINLPIPQNALQARLSTKGCFTDARTALAPGGIVVLVTPGSEAYLDLAARQRHASMLATLRTVFPSVGVSPGAQTFFWASVQAVDARPGILVARMRARRLVLSHIGATWLLDRLLPFHTAGYLRSLSGVVAVVNRDFRPVVYLFGLAETFARVSPKLGRLALLVVRAPWAPAILVLLVLASAGLFVLMGRGGPSPRLAVVAAGGAAMALQIVILLAFQAIRGHLYHALGGLIAASMVGMAAGAWLAPRFLHRGRALARLCLLAAGVAAMMPAALLLARTLPEVATTILVLLAATVGASMGAVFPVAVQVSAQSASAARLYAWDLLGAAGAAVGASLLGVPLLGLYSVAWLCAAVCAAAGLANLRGG